MGEQSEARTLHHHLARHPICVMRGGTWLAGPHTCHLYKAVILVEEGKRMGRQRKRGSPLGREDGGYQCPSPRAPHKCLHPKLVKWLPIKAFEVLLKNRDTQAPPQPD